MAGAALTWTAWPYSSLYSFSRRAITRSMSLPVSSLNRLWKKASRSALVQPARKTETAPAADAARNWRRVKRLHFASSSFRFVCSRLTLNRLQSADPSPVCPPA